MAEHVMENEFLRVTVSDHGAELVSVWDKKRKTERIWQADPAVWNRHAPVLFPFVGKVNGGVYRYRGKSYEMKTQHGFARDMEFTCVSEREDKLIHRLTSTEETLGKYPFAFTLYITHRFSEENPRELLVSWEVINENDDTMYYSIGGHPAFLFPENPKESRDQYWLEFPGKEHLEYLLLNPQNGLAATGTTYDLKLRGGCYPIEEHLFDRDALVFEGGQIGEVRIDRPDKTPYVTLRCAGFPFVGIWSKPDGAFVCLEPWMGRTDDDGFTGDLAEKIGVESLKARENRMYTYGIEFH